jgi:hypothetical protein
MVAVIVSNHCCAYAVIYLLARLESKAAVEGLLISDRSVVKYFKM